MARAPSSPDSSDRLSAVLDELDAVRRSPGWLPTEETVVDRRRPRILGRRSTAQTSAGTSGSGRHRAGAGDDERIRPHEPLVRAPTAFRDPQVAPSRLALIGALALVLVAAVIFGGRVLLSKASAAPHPVSSTASAPVGGSALKGHGRRSGFGASSAPAPAQPASPSTPATVVVQVVGQVHKPGVVQLKSGSRVKDAVTAAGGALPSADLTRVNMARVVVDGEQIHIPKPGETVTPPPVAAPPAAATGAGDASTSTVVDLNTADEQTLESLSGVGPVLAQRIIDWRTTNGRFNSVDELGEVSGIGDKMMQQLRSHVRV